jgi:hypothetical protein
MQEREFIPNIGMNKKAFWDEVKARAKKHEADNILIYMGLMLEKSLVRSRTCSQKRLRKLRQTTSFIQRCYGLV